MSQTALFWPAFAQVLLVIGLMVVMGTRRAHSIRSRRQTPDDVAMGRTEDWDDEANKAANNFRNQFEIPVLFFAAVAMALALRVSDGVLVTLAWVFVVARLAHATIHVTVNKTMTRMYVWLVSVAAMLAMWVWLAVKLA